MNRCLRALGLVALILPPGMVSGSEADGEDRPADSRAMVPRQSMSDVALLERYASVDLIESDRLRELQLVQVSVGDSRQRLDAAREQRSGALQNELYFYANRSLPQDLVERLKSNAREQASAQKTISDGEAMNRRINEKYDELVRRFRSLNVASPIPSLRDLPIRRPAP